jgi:hypothetical protein
MGRMAGAGQIRTRLRGHCEVDPPPQEPHPLPPGRLPTSPCMPPCLSVSHPSLILVCIGVQVDDDELSSVLDGADLSTSLLQPRKQVDRRHPISSQVHKMILPIPHPGPSIF